MKKLLALGSLICVTLGSIQMAALADGDWFDKQDQKHSGKWDYKAFKKAEHDWAKNHHEYQKMREKEMKAKFKELDRDHDGYLHREDVREWHQW